MQILSKILPQVPNFAIFRHPKKGFLTALNLLYEVLPKQFKAFGFHFFSLVKKCNVFGKKLAKNPEFCHPKLSGCYDRKAPNNFAATIAIFCSSESKNLVNFVKFRQKSIFS